ncbi:precorrin-3B synthase [Terrabacter carboxydivorans]|uniref:Nitrite/sulfite reductase n=1 Tax=Terrabacter carboxydivorans TaxID=619730 RepID=A0ABP5YUU9_9MICO
MCRVTAPSSRERRAGDACPGLQRPFAAADGSIVRLRPAGQPVAVEALITLREVIAAQPDPAIQLTSRGALQLRGLPDPLTPRVHDAIRATGLVPSPTHELVRNVVASPLSGLDGAGRCDVRPVVADLDQAVCADPRLSRLGGRFLFVVDDGRGDVVDLSSDLAFVATGPDRGVVLAGSHDDGWEVSLDGAVDLIVRLAVEFVERAADDESVWHVDDLDDPLTLGGPAYTARPDRIGGMSRAGALPHPLGAVGQHAVVAVPLGLLRPHHVAALARTTDAVRVTPWRSLVVEDGAAALPELEAAGFATHSGSPWHRLHACTGLPGCSRSAVDTRALARDLAPVLPAGRLPVHVSGCERRCGTPSTAYLDVLAPRSTEEALSTIAEQESSWT